jgi:hypothetical protein
MDLRQREREEVGTGLQSIGQAISEIIRLVSRRSFYPRERICKWPLNSLIQDIKIVRFTKMLRRNTESYLRVFRFSQGSGWCFCSSGMWYRVTGWMVPEVSRQHSSLFVKIPIPETMMYLLDFRLVWLDQYLDTVTRDVERYFSPQERDC